MAKYSVEITKESKRERERGIKITNSLVAVILN